MSNAPFLPLLLTIIEAVGTLAFALSGLLEAARKRLDAVGVCLVAGLAAFGGGTLRDVLLDRRPFVWVAHSEWLWVLLALCIAAMAFLRARHFAPTEKAMQWPDALGLGFANMVPVLFSAAGQLPGIAPAQGIAAVASVGYFGMMAGPPLIGFIAEARSLAAGLLVVVFFAVVVAALARRALGGARPA